MSLFNAFLRRLICQSVVVNKNEVWVGILSTFPEDRLGLEMEKLIKVLLDILHIEYVRST